MSADIGYLNLALPAADPQLLPQAEGDVLSGHVRRDRLTEMLLRLLVAYTQLVPTMIILHLQVGGNALSRHGKGGWEEVGKDGEVNGKGDEEERRQVRTSPRSSPLYLSLFSFLPLLVSMRVSARVCVSVHVLTTLLPWPAQMGTSAQSAVDDESWDLARRVSKLIIKRRSDSVCPRPPPHTHTPSVKALSPALPCPLSACSLDFFATDS